MTNTIKSLLCVALVALVGCTQAEDFDQDWVPNEADNCPYDANAVQTDKDGDRVGDVCDWDEYIQFEVTPADTEGYRYHLKAVFPAWYYIVQAAAFSVESYAPVTLKTEYESDLFPPYPFQAPPHTQAFAVYGHVWDDWDEDSRSFIEHNEQEAYLGRLVFEHPQPPPTISLHGSTNLPGFEEGALWYNELPHSRPATPEPGGNNSSDWDQDGVGDNVDNCLILANSSQRNADGDQAGDVCDWDAADPTVFFDPATGMRPQSY